jgi:hypothetical protein
LLAVEKTDSEADNDKHPRVYPDFPSSSSGAFKKSNPQLTITYIQHDSDQTPLKQPKWCWAIIKESENQLGLDWTKQNLDRVHQQGHS